MKPAEGIATAAKAVDKVITAIFNLDAIKEYSTLLIMTILMAEAPKIVKFDENTPRAKKNGPPKRAVKLGRGN
jgi:hypothetical protein